MTNMQSTIVGKRWDCCSEGYSGIVNEELREEYSQKWTRIILEQAPYSGTLSILDVGTGPGYFATILSLAGHELTGIDCSAEMIEKAKENSEQCGVFPLYEVADNHETGFPDDSFDMIISRNVTWTLYDPEKAYREWLRILKPGGRLLYFDANWHYELLSKEQRRLIDADREQYTKRYGDPVNTFTGTQKLNDDFNSLLVMQKRLRPVWDLESLPDFGYTNVRAVPRVNERVYAPSKALLVCILQLMTDLQRGVGILQVAGAGDGCGNILKRAFYVFSGGISAIISDFFRNKVVEASGGIREMEYVKILCALRQRKLPDLGFGSVCFCTQAICAAQTIGSHVVTPEKV